ncbi:MAG: FAD-binding oxidoreductase [Paracoccaceae bacterium]|nr:FAD-binding oxidoreductase [Paracoccaceae bacterium]
MSWKQAEYSGWGRALRASGELARPERARHLAAVMAASPSPAIGNRRSYGDACLNSGGKAVDLTRLDRILGFDEDTGLLDVEAGVGIGALADIFAPRGWLPPVMPGTGYATVGGCIANDVHGKNHHNDGTFGAHVESFTLVTPNGEETVRADDALFGVSVAGLGQTGAIRSARIAMKRAKGDVMIVTERRIADWDEHLALLDASEATYTVGWVDATARGAGLGRGILEEGETGSGLVPRPKGAKSVPLDAPGFALSPPVVRLFNEAYWRRVPGNGRTVVKPINDFFFPLDKIRDWNRLYGKTGFHQFQCVVPLDAAGALRAIMEKITRAGIASPLAVLKRMGPGRAGLMSFPMEGYTLAVDFPNRGRAAELVRSLVRDTADAGGRIYLAKDSLAEPETVAAMYPERAAWAKAVATIDPDGQFETDLTRRLKLRAP